MLVVDCSVIMAATLDEPGPGDPGARVLAAIESGMRAFAPGLFAYECRNALLMAERRGRLTREAFDLELRSLEGLGIVLDGDLDDGRLRRMLALARRHRLTVYDAAYLELAHRHAAPLASLDKAMVRAARSEGVAIFA